MICGKLTIAFDFHVGVVGCGVRRPSAPLERILPNETRRMTVVEHDALDVLLVHRHSDRFAVFEDDAHAIRLRSKRREHQRNEENREALTSHDALP